MGTSTNQRSQSTPNWRAAQATYVDPAMPVDRVIQEMWRAATNQPVGDIAAGLTAAVVLNCLQIAVAADSREAAVSEATRSVARSGQVSLAAEIAVRAVGLSFRSGVDRIDAYTASLFAEASNYLVSRDLPSFFGAGERTQSISQILAFKAELRQGVAERVQSVPVPSPNRLPDEWKSYVGSVVTKLRDASSKAR